MNKWITLELASPDVAAGHLEGVVRAGGGGGALAAVLAAPRPAPRPAHHRPRVAGRVRRAATPAAASADILANYLQCSMFQRSDQTNIQHSLSGGPSSRHHYTKHYALHAQCARSVYWKKSCPAEGQDNYLIVEASPSQFYLRNVFTILWWQLTRRRPLRTWGWRSWFWQPTCCQLILGTLHRRAAHWSLITADRLLASACSGDSDQRTTSKLSTYLYITCI